MMKAANNCRESEKIGNRRRKLNSARALQAGAGMNRDLKEKGLRLDPVAIVDRSGGMNRDLKEKGLRQAVEFNFINLPV